MTTPGWIIVVVLVVTNVTLVVSEIIRRLNLKKEVQELRRKKEDEMADRSGAESLETLSDEDLEDEIEPKQRHIWILGIVICLNIWILGAVGTHWWATTYFADDVAATAVCHHATVESSVTQTEVSDATTRGLFGDSFGAVNALVSALAFAGMIVAFILQRYELRLQRKELRDSRGEMRRQTLQFKIQNDNLELQRFENTFFHMLELHKQNLQEIDVQGIKGREVFNKLLDQLSKIYYAVEQSTNEIKEKSLVGILGSVWPHETINYWSEKRIKDFNIKYAYGLFFYGSDFHISHDKSDETRLVEDAVLKHVGDDITDAFQLVLNSDKQGVSSYLGHYYRHIYQTVCFVDSQKQLKPEQKYSYVKMLRAQLSDYEQILFYYNAMSSMGASWLALGDDDLSLITRYKLIKNVPHFYTYFFNEPQAQFMDEIKRWKEQHPGEYFFEQITQLD